jgi:hypothetical protein
MQRCSLHEVKQGMIININQQVASESADASGQGGESVGGRRAELAYLCHFIQCHQPCLQIVNWATWPIYVMANRETKIGIAFCDLQLPELTNDHNFAIIDNVIYPDPGTISELWLVFVAKNIQQHQSFFRKLAREHELTDTFDKIFLFDFYQSVIQLIK